MKVPRVPTELNDSADDLWLIVRTSNGTRPIIVRFFTNRLLAAQASTDHRTTIDRSSYDVLQWHTGYGWPISKFCKHMSAGHCPMIGRGPFAVVIVIPEIHLLLLSWFRRSLCCFNRDFGDLLAVAIVNLEIQRSVAIHFYRDNRKSHRVTRRLTRLQTVCIVLKYRKIL